MNVTPNANTGRKTVAIVVGPTRGHVYPALAVGEALERAWPGVEIVIVDTEGGLGARLLAGKPWRRATVAALPLARVDDASRRASLAAVVAGIAPARRALEEHGVDLVLGLGAFVMASVVLAARADGIPTALHEPNAEPGLANRALAALVDRVYIGHRALERVWPWRSTFVGHPVRAGVAALAGEPKSAPGGRAARILVATNVGGGAFFAGEVPRLCAGVARLGVAVEVLHQCGDDAAGPVADAYARAGVAARVVPHLDDAALTAALRWADFAVARGGSGTLAELAVAGVPALVVPLADAAWDHQAANARAWERAGAGFWSREDAARIEPLAARAARLLGDAGAWRSASDAARALATADAAERLAAACAALLAGRA
jgi:UDP-N-acetylglucosamine--N-acetylmuramyl-(pentapeptide) pyrophosphoryl-undecaprenol N-acetylglucosamine transferase